MVEPFPTVREFLYANAWLEKYKQKTKKGNQNLNLSARK